MFKYVFCCRGFPVTFHVLLIFGISTFCSLVLLSSGTFHGSISGRMGARSQVKLGGTCLARYQILHVNNSMHRVLPYLCSATTLSFCISRHCEVGWTWLRSSGPTTFHKQMMAVVRGSAISILPNRLLAKNADQTEALTKWATGWTAERWSSSSFSSVSGNARPMSLLSSLSTPVIQS